MSRLSRPQPVSRAQSVQVAEPDESQNRTQCNKWTEQRLCHAGGAGRERGRGARKRRNFSGRADLDEAFNTWTRNVGEGVKDEKQGLGGGERRREGGWDGWLKSSRKAGRAWRAEETKPTSRNAEGAGYLCTYVPPSTAQLSCSARGRLSSGESRDGIAVWDKAHCCQTAYT